MKHISISILILAIFFGVAFNCYAGNQNNASASGNVTAAVVCEVDDATEVDEVSVVVVSAGCSLELAPSSLADLECDKGNTCMRCLGELKAAGLTITSANAYVENEDGEEPAELAYHLLEGNAAPFLDRLGSCPD